MSGTRRLEHSAILERHAQRFGELKRDLEKLVSDHQKSSFFDLSPEASNIICAEGAIIRPIIHGVLWGEWPAP